MSTRAAPDPGAPAPHGLTSADLEAALASLPTAVIIADGRRLVAMNPAALRLYGVASLEEAQQASTHYRGTLELRRANGEVLGPDEWPGDRAARGEVVQDEELHARRDGAEWVGLCSAIPFRSSDGRRLVTITIRDITAIRQMDQPVRDSEARLRTLAEALPQIVWTTDASGKVESFNQRWVAYTGLATTTGEALGWREVVHPGDLRRTLEAWDRSLTTGTAYDIEHRLRRHDGEYRWFLGRAYPLRDAEGRVVRWFGTSTDIHRLKRAEQALLEADRRKDEFLGALSHELRNPLAPIRTSVYILDHAEPNSEPARRAKEVIGRQVDHLTRIVDDLLDVTRIARGKIELHRERLDLSALVRRAGEDHRALITERGVDLVVEVPKETAWVDGDVTRLSQIIGNLLQNSAKFTGRGGRVTIALRREDSFAAISVKDTGVGIAPDLMPQLFAPFVQEKRTLARTEGGLGLGLALVKGLAELHGGSVTVASEGVGKGSEFVVRVPAAAEETAPAGAKEHLMGGSSRRVLVVDDNRDAAESLAELVELFGHHAELAFDGHGAVAKAQANPPDVILCDIGLPGMDGYEVARTLRADPALRGTKLIAVSGYAQPEDRKRAADCGFDGHVAKPPDPDEIERLIAR